MIYFTPNTDKKIDFTKVDFSALAKLQIAREIANIPFTITSHYRTPEHSEKVGGSKTDAHTRIPCGAFDIYCTNSRERLKILRGVIEAGFKRIGLNEKHIHVDNCSDLPQDVFFIERKA